MTSREPDEPALVVIKPSPLNAETPVPALAAPVTPGPQVYVRSNFATPPLDPDHHRLTIDGAVAVAFEIGIAELRALPQHTVVTTMECAGNDRLAMRPLPAGEPWQSGALSTVRWAGVPLAPLLARAGLRADAIEIVAAGADAGPREDADGPVRFARSIPLRTALHPDTMLALAMNDEPLTPAHGAPVRLVVPGWYGMASVKWVARLEAVTEPFDGYFQTRRYVYTSEAGTTPVDLMRVKSIIVAPADGAVLDAPTVEVWGWAWSGAGEIVRVEVASGGGEAWHDAVIEPPASSHAWSRWRATLALRGPGRHALRSRATDASGAVQPDEPDWNVLGYGNNAVRTAVVELRGP